MDNAGFPQQHYPVELNGNTWVGELLVPPHASGVLICLGDDCAAYRSAKIVQTLRIATLPLQLRQNQLDASGKHVITIVNWVYQHAPTRNKPIFIAASGSVSHTQAALSAAITDDTRIAGLILNNAGFDDGSVEMLERISQPMLIAVQDKRQLADVLPERLDENKVHLLQGLRLNSEVLAEWLSQYVQPPLEENPL